MNDLGYILKVISLNNNCYNQNEVSDYLINLIGNVIKEDNSDLSVKNIVSIYSRLNAQRTKDHKIKFNFQGNKEIFLPNDDVICKWKYHQFDEDKILNLYKKLDALDLNPKNILLSGFTQPLAVIKYANTSSANIRCLLLDDYAERAEILEIILNRFFDYDTKIKWEGISWDLRDQREHCNWYIGKDFFMHNQQWPNSNESNKINENDLILLNNLYHERDNYFEEWYFQEPVIKEEPHGKLKEGCNRLYDKQKNLVLFASLALLNKSGLCFFPTESEMLINLNNSKKESVLWMLPLLNYYLRGVLKLDISDFDTGSEINNFGIISKGKQEKNLFVATCNSNNTLNKELGYNLLNSVHTRELAYGKLVPFGGFINFKEYEARLEFLESLNKYFDAGFIWMRLCKEVKLKPDGHDESSFYILKRSSTNNKEYTSDYEYVKQRINSYLEIKVNPEYIDADFLEYYFKGNLGVNFRRVVSQGNSTGAIKSDILKTMQIPIPEKSIQKKIIDFHLTIQANQENLKILESDLLDKPYKLEKTLEDLGKIDNKKLYKPSHNWPFPIAIMDKMIDAEIKPKEKFERWWKFIESLVMFECTFIIGILKQFNTETNQVIEILSNLQDELSETPAFGSWRNLLGKLKKELKTLTKNQENINIINKIIGIKDLDFIEAIKSTACFPMIEHTINVRNDHHGHGGILSAHLASKIIEKINKLWNENIHLYHSIFSGFTLITHNEYMKRKPNGYELEVTMLNGSSSAFLNKRIELQDALLTDRLYMHYAGSRSCILLPDTLILSSNRNADKDAFYFFNNFKNNKADYKSYHFETEPNMSVDVGVDSVEFYRNPFATIPKIPK